MIPQLLLLLLAVVPAWTRVTTTVIHTTTVLCYDDKGALRSCPFSKTSLIVTAVIIGIFVVFLTAMVAYYMIKNRKGRASVREINVVSLPNYGKLEDEDALSLGPAASRSVDTLPEYKV